MRLQFKPNKQKEFLREAKRLKNRTWKEFAYFLQVNTGTLKNWTKESKYLPEIIFNRIINYYPQLKFYEKYIIERKKDNWGQVKGGILGNKTVCRKLKTDRKFRAMWIRNSKRGGRNNIKNGLIKNWQIGFRNIGIRKFIGPKNEKMFTESEKRLAEFFFENKIEYEYEPLLKIGTKSYFPDFVINKIIIERCGVISREYFRNLQNKLNDYKRINKKVIVILPKRNKNTFLKNVKIPRNFVCLIEDKNLEGVTEFLKNQI